MSRGIDSTAGEYTGARSQSNGFDIIFQPNETDKVGLLHPKPDYQPHQNPDLRYPCQLDATQLYS
jgi:hypothetical protein